MADDKKVKKKKSKAKAEEAPVEAAPAPEPVAAPEPAPAAPAPAEDAPAPAEGEEGALVEGEEMAEPPPAPKKKPVYFVHWNRRKPRFYDYNFDYGTNYYSSVVNYIGTKSLGSNGDMPRRMAFAERGIYSSIDRKSKPDLRTDNIMKEVQGSIRGFENFQKSYVADSQRRGIS